MTCPECGYVLSPFDQDCPRCRKLTASEPRTVVLRPAPGPTAVPVPSEVLVCVVCGSEDVQKVPAIVQAGTWVVQTPGQQAQTADPSRSWGAAERGAGITRGATVLAQMLLPPSKPERVSSSWLSLVTGSLGVVLSVLAFILAGVWVGGCLVAMALAAWVWASAYESGLNMRAQRRYEAEMIGWEETMAVWSRSLYCARCHHVSDPVTRKSVGPERMHAIY